MSSSWRARRPRARCLRRRIGRTVRLARRGTRRDEAADELDAGGQASFLLSASCCCAVASAFWSASSCCFALVTWTCAWCRLEAFDACCSAVAPLWRTRASPSPARGSPSRSPGRPRRRSRVESGERLTHLDDVTDLHLHRGDGSARGEIRRRRTGHVDVARRRHGRLHRPARHGDRALGARRRRSAADEPVDGVQREDHRRGDAGEGDSVPHASSPRRLSETADDRVDAHAVNRTTAG